MSDTDALFSPAELRRLDRLRIRRRRPHASDQPGDWRSGRVGQGALFADHRDYVPGDDLRYVDWNVYARHGDLVVKRFEVEENLDLTLCIDRSLSMTGAKSLAVRRLAGALGYIALAHMDRVRLAWMPVHPNQPITIHGGQGRGPTLLQAIAAEPEIGETAHAKDVARILSVTQRRGLAVVLSDFYDPQNSVAALSGLCQRGMDVIAIHALDADDVDLQLGDSLRVIDRETGAEVKLDVTEGFLENLRAAWQRRAESLERWCVGREVLYQRLDVHTSLWDVLAEMLGRGAAVGARR